MSSYLFILCAECLPSLIRTERQGLRSGIRMRELDPQITHLLFADDSLLFAKVENQSVENIKGILINYEKMSGQKVNLEKSRLYQSSNITGIEKEELASRMVKIDNGSGMYLGMPYMIGRSRKEMFSFVKERVWKKLNGWKENTLSQAGKEVLIKAVVQAIPAYIMSCFKLNKALCNEINAMVRNFWWGQKGEQKRICWRSWNKLCRRKGEGGIGFSDLEAFNWALLAK